MYLQDFYHVIYLSSIYLSVIYPKPTILTQNQNGGESIHDDLEDGACDN